MLLLFNNPFLSSASASVREIRGTFPASSSGQPAYAQVTTTRTPRSLRLSGGNAGDRLQVFEISDAQYQLYKASPALMLAALASQAPKLDLTIGAGGVASTGSMATEVTAGNWLVFVPTVATGELELTEPA